MNFNYIKCPCRDCEKRECNCHATCEEYKDYEIKHRTEVQKVNSERYVECEIVSMKKERGDTLRRKYGAKKY